MNISSKNSYFVSNLGENTEIIKYLAKKQAHVFEYLSKSFIKQRLSNAYLFVGANKNDINFISKFFNLSMNCSQNSISKNEFYCGECQNCKWILSDSHPKTPIVLEVEAGAKNIKVESIRKLLAELTHKSEFQRVALIKDASKNSLNSHSATALLKSIEEASEGSVYLLFTESKENVLPTIVSRCTCINLNYYEDEKTAEVNSELNELWQNSFDQVNNDLDIYKFCDSLAEFESNDLIDFLHQLSNQKNQNPDAVSAAQVYLIDECLSNIRSSIRLKPSLKSFISKMRKAELDYAL